MSSIQDGRSFWNGDTAIYSPGSPLYPSSVAAPPAILQLEGIEDPAEPYTPITACKVVSFITLESYGDCLTHTYTEECLRCWYSSYKRNECGLIKDVYIAS
jgi:hypothetical protein